MKVVVVRANPRKNGHTESLTNLFIEGMQQAQANVEQINLSSKNINCCLGCYNCWLVTPGKCVHVDDMESIMRNFCQADIAVFTTPLYIYNVSAYLKVFQDRLLPYMTNLHLATSSGNIRNAIRHPDQWPKKMAYILVGAFRGLETFSGAKKSLELFAEGLQMPLGGGLIRPESYLLPFMYLKPRTIKTVKAAFRKAGHELITQGYIAKETIAQAGAPLSESIEHFLEDSNIYWEEAQKQNQQAMDPAFVTNIVMRNPKILISEMARHMAPDTTAKLKATIQFHFTDQDIGFTIRIDKGSCATEENIEEAGDLKITTTSSVWAQIFLRELDPRQALKEQKITLTGDKSLFARLHKFFPLPSD